MKRVLRLSVLLLLVAAAAGAASVPARAADAPTRFAVHAAHLIDGRSAAARGPVWVVVSGDTIESVETSAPAGLHVVDLGGATLLPGLIDLHTHLGSRVGVPRMERQFQSTPARNAITATVNARATLMAGFTTCRDVGGGGLVDVALRDAIDAGEIPGPRLQVATNSLSMTGGHGDPMNSLNPDWCYEGYTGVADGVDEVRKKVRTNVRNGADLIKILATGGVLSPRDDPRHTAYSMEELETAVAEAGRLERFVAAHTHGKEGIVWASNAGVRTVDHASYMDDEAARVLKRNGTWYVPTLYVIEPILAEGNPLKIQAENLEKARVVKDHMRRAFRSALRAGVKIGFGTDAGVFPHGTQAREFAIYVDEGMTPLHAIQSATRDAAECMGWSGRVGEIRPGAFADMIAVAGDPLRNIRALESVGWVMKGGTVWKDEIAK